MLPNLTAYIDPSPTKIWQNITENYVHKDTKSVHIHIIKCMWNEDERNDITLTDLLKQVK